MFNYTEEQNRPIDLTSKCFQITAKTVFILDVDGTVAPITSAPDGRIVDSNAFQAMKSFNEAYPNQVILATARDGHQIRTCFDKDLSVFPNILSNGAELRLPGGMSHTYPFTAREENFVKHMQEKMAVFRSNHPWLLTEIKANEIGYHTLYAKTTNSQLIEKKRLCESIVQARKLFNELCDQARRNGVPYALFKSHEKTHRAIAHTKINKADSMQWFSPYLSCLSKGQDWSSVVFCGDGFLSNDRDIAAKVRAGGGTAIMITNGHKKNIPSKNDKAEPHIVLESPAHLGRVLKQSVDQFLGRNTL